MSKKSEVLDQLKRLRSESNRISECGFNSPEFRRWHAEISSILYENFSDEDIVLDDFKKLDFEPRPEATDFFLKQIPKSENDLRMILEDPEKYRKDAARDFSAAYGKMVSDDGINRIVQQNIDVVQSWSAEKKDAILRQNGRPPLSGPV